MDIHRWNLRKSCLWDFKNSTCTSGQKRRKTKGSIPEEKSVNTTSGDSVITKSAACEMKTPPAPGYPLFFTWFFGNKAEKTLIFQETWGGKQGAGLFDPADSWCFHSGHLRSGQIIIGCLGGKQSCGISLQPDKVRPLDADKAFLLNKPIPKAAVWYDRLYASK